MTILATVASIAWAAITSASLENHAGDPRLIRAMMVAGIAIFAWLVLMVMREAEQFVWRQALVSTFFVIAGQGILFLILSSLRLRYGGDIETTKS